MMNLNDAAFSAPIKISLRRISVAMVSFVLLGFSAWRFSTVAGFNLWYIAGLGFAMVFYTLAPIYSERKEYRIDAYNRHLKMLDLETLQKYESASENSTEKSLIEYAIAEKQYL